MKSHTLQELIDSIYADYPNISDIWEIVAIVDGLGYTDRTIQAEFGCPNALVLSQFIYAQRDKIPVLNYPDPSGVKLVDRNPQKPQVFSNLIYTIPFTIQLILGYLPIDKTKDFLSPDVNALLPIVIMASLITSSGFVRMISHRGLFHLRSQDLIQSNRICIPILSIGIIVTILLSFVGILVGFDRQIAADQYIILAGIYYLMMSSIWLLFALVGIQYRYAALIVSTAMAFCFGLLRIFSPLSAIESQIIIAIITLLSLTILAIFNGIKHRSTKPRFGEIAPLPNLSVLVYLLAPHFLYGLIYFGFIFADRLAANLATGGIYTLIAGDRLSYQNSMDIALLNLLLIIPLVEYFSYKQIVFWYDRAKHITLDEVANLAWRLQKYYWTSLTRIFLFFGMLMIITMILLVLLDRNLTENILTIVACFGYLLFAIGLFNTVILLSLVGVASPLENRLRDVLNILVSATIINFILGYLLSSIAGVYFAVIGLIVGGAIFALASTQKTLAAIDRADYCYFYSDY